MTGFANQIYVQAVSQPQVQTTIGQLTNTLIRHHRIKPGQPNDFSMRNPSQFVETAESSSRIMALLLAAVASISLLVSGIGIMNILLVSVTERTREIGLRMAMGARRPHLLLQFLAEAVFLSVRGGFAGILMGVAFSAAIPVLFGWLAPVSFAAILGRFVFSAAVGIFCGYSPGAQSRPSRSNRGPSLRVISGATTNIALCPFSVELNVLRADWRVSRDPVMSPIVPTATPSSQIEA
jgi:macrolide transport system ATP-binding/permease protein